MTLSYQNPVYAFDFADPFVLKSRGRYYAYGTAQPVDGRMFPLLRSADLVHWEKIGGALEPLSDPPAFAYWAPEVAEKDGRYYMYYSAAMTRSDDSHRLRLAIAPDPVGPFIDTGHVLMPEAGFTIDASPFQDPQTGKWYLFFATDYEQDEPHGTGLAVVSMADDMHTITSPPTSVMRARSDWQIYERNRNYKGRVWEKWHCLEGPHCIYHGSKYILFYSGGAWHGDAYGVGFAVADHPMGPWQDVAAEASVLKGVPGSVIGPGHTSCTIGPDGKLYMVYHAWDVAKTGRRMCIDPILWTEDGPVVDGPTTQKRVLVGA